MKIKKAYKGVVFDLDGTLLNTIETYSNIMNELLSRKKFPLHETSLYNTFIGNGAKNFIRLSLPEEKRQETVINSMLHDFHKIYEETYNKHSRSYEGITSLLLKLQASEIKLGILSNKLHHLTIKCADYFFPKINFEKVLEQSEQYKKPNPEGLLDISKSLNLDSKDILFVGDTEVDIETAQNAKTYCATVTWGYRTRDTLALLKPNYIIESPENLLKIIHEPKLF
ncbi:MAG TPA: HAD family hydrolase [Tenacibaculum sp.]|nr:HAD family hydrolase [Tenacibaculum sp.]